MNAGRFLPITELDIPDAVLVPPRCWDLCHTWFMEQKQTRQEVLGDLVRDGAITAEQADRIVHAPTLSFTMRELVTYLASLIIAVGVFRILAIALEDASQAAISAGLYVVATGSALASWKLSSGSVVRRRFAEVLELGALGAFLGASAIWMLETPLDERWVGVICFAATSVWGWYRCAATSFAGTVALAVGVPALGGTLGALTESDSPWITSLFAGVPGVILIVAGTRRIGAAVLARATGSLFYVIGAMSFGAGLSYGKVAPIVLGAALFAVGATLLTPEMLVAGAFLVVAGVVMSVVRWVSNDLAQGLVIIATGLAVLAVLSMQMRRAVSRPGPGTPVV